MEHITASLPTTAELLPQPCGTAEAEAQLPIEARLIRHSIPQGMGKAGGKYHKGRC